MLGPSRMCYPATFASGEGFLRMFASHLNIECLAVVFERQEFWLMFASDMFENKRRSMFSRHMFQVTKLSEETKENWQTAVLPDVADVSLFSSVYTCPPPDTDHLGLALHDDLSVSSPDLTCLLEEEEAKRATGGCNLKYSKVFLIHYLVISST